MTTLRILRAPDYPRMPWKNGGGSTEEIDRDNGIGLDDFGWRASVADIAQAGDFSRFVGYRRLTTVLQGEGMVLTVDGKQTRPLLPYDAFAFAGEAPVTCDLLAGTVRSFNLIYQPGTYLARQQWFDGIVPSQIFTSAETILIFSACDDLQVRVAGHAAQTLGIYDCAIVHQRADLLKVGLGGRCCVVELTAR